MTAFEKQKDMMRVCQLIIDDMEADASALDGKPFDGRTVSKQFGENMAAIQALARICKGILEDDCDPQGWRGALNRIAANNSADPLLANFKQGVRDGLAKASAE